jgi:hypothetical protein
LKQRGDDATIALEKSCSVVAHLRARIAALNHDETQKIGAKCRITAEDCARLQTLLKCRDRLFVQFSRMLKQKQQDFHPNSRQWAFKKLEVWLNDFDSEHKILWLKGCAGTGKSTWLAQTEKSFRSRVAAVHMFLHNDSRTSNLRNILLSVTGQMCSSIPGFKEALLARPASELKEVVDNHEDLDLGQIFDTLLFGPFDDMDEPDSVFVILIDALDECQEQSKVFELITQQLCHLSPWVRLVVTSQPGTDIASALTKGSTLLNISFDSCNGGDVNECDTRAYLRDILESKVAPVELEQMVDRVLRTQATFMFLSFINRRVAQVETDDEHFHHTR